MPKVATPSRRCRPRTLPPCQRKANGDTLKIDTLMTSALEFIYSTSTPVALNSNSERPKNWRQPDALASEMGTKWAQRRFSESEMRV